MFKSFMKSKLLLLLVVCTLVFNAFVTVEIFAEEESSMNAPVGYQPSNSEPANLFRGLVQMVDSPEILLIEDVNPWGVTSHHTLLQTMGQLTKISSSQVANTDLYMYDIVILANDQYTSTYNNYAGFKSNLEQYVANGGIVIFGASDRGWNGGILNYDLPGGLRIIGDYQNNNVISDYEHYIVTGELTNSVSLTNADLYGSYCSHTSFVESTIPYGGNVVLRDSKGNPTLVEYPLGNGKVIGSGLTWEHNLVYTQTFSVKAFADLYMYSIYSASDSFFFNVSPVSSIAGDEVDVTVSIKNNPGIAGLSLELGFDNNYLQPVSIGTTGSALRPVYSNISSNNDLSSVGAITAVWSNASNADENGDLFTVRFRIKENAYIGNYPLILTGMVVNELFEDVDFGVRQGVLSVVDGQNVLYGDIYTDGSIDIKDAVKLAQYLAGKISFNTYEKFAADVHKDDVIDIRDAIKLSQYLAGYKDIVLGSK